MRLRNRVRAGKLRHRADIEHWVVSGSGGRGQPIGSWLPLYQSVPIEVVPLRGRELEVARQLIAKSTHRVELRYLSGVTAEMRLRYGTRLFNIGWVDEGDFRRHNMRMLVTEEATGPSPT